MKKIEIRALLYISFLCCYCSAFQQPTLQFIGVSNKTSHELCDLGCKCPEPGMKFIFLDCSSRAITNLPTSLQFEQPLTKVSFYGNHLETLRMSTFAKVDSIEELDFSVNHITRVENFTLTPFRSLSVLKITHNRLPQLTTGLLEGLSNLRVLEVGYNTIRVISPEAFRPTPQLQELRLQYNPLFELDENLFQYLPNLKNLDLQETGLVRLPNEIFKPTPLLQWLSLSDNAFEIVPENSLSHAIMLENLNLSGNDFTILVQGNFRRLPQLSHLHLNYMMKLRQIEKDALAGLRRLKSFSCSFNPKLEYIDEEVFGSKNSSVSKFKTPPSEQLYLRQNALRTLKSPLEPEQWSSLSFVDLTDNPWKCDCKLQWMKDLPKEVQMSIVCESPPHLRGRVLVEIDASEMTCEFDWTLANFVLIISCIVAFAVILLAVSVSVCSRTPAGLYIRAKKQFSYAKVIPKTETVDLEWDPSADL